MYCRAHNVWHCRSRACVIWYGENSYSYPGMPDFGIDVTSGDPVVNFGGGFGEDLRTGELEFEVAPGIDIPLD